METKVVEREWDSEEFKQMHKRAVTEAVTRDINLIGEELKKEHGRIMDEPARVRPVGQGVPLEHDDSLEPVSENSCRAQPGHAGAQHDRRTADHRSALSIGCSASTRVWSASRPANATNTTAPRTSRSW